jgi:hypothetical protein
MAITRTPIIDDDGSGTSGTVLDNAWKQELYGQIDAVVTAGSGKAWTTMPAGTTLKDDGAVSLAMTVALNRYRQLGNNTVVWEFAANPVTITSASSSLYLFEPGFGMLGPAGATYPVAWGPLPTYLQWVNSGTVIWKRADGANWAAGGAWLYFSIIVEASGG